MINISLTEEQAEELKAIWTTATVEKDTNNEDILYVKLEGLGRQLRMLRLKKGISIKWLSEEANISPAFMCKVEHGQMILTKSAQLCAWVKALGYSEVRIAL